MLTLLLVTKATPKLTTLQKVDNVTWDQWVLMGSWILGFMIALVLIRKFQESTNKTLIVSALLLLFSITFMKWVYFREEPKFLTPYVEVISQFVPTAGHQPREVPGMIK